MDLVQVFTSSESQEQHRQSSFSDGNRDNTSTDIERSTKHKIKTKNIKKKYDPIQENGIVYHYEDDPQEYKRVRKKVQNRLSARRVRGRKQNAFQSLQQQVEYLRKVNSQMQLSNARLQTEVRSLKQQLDFMKGLVKPNQNTLCKTDPIDKYLSPETLTDNNSSIPSSSDYESPFMEEESDWFRLPNLRHTSNNWAMLTIFTLVLAVFILPSETTTSSPTVMFQTSQSQNDTVAIKTWSESLIAIFVFSIQCVKTGLKYFLIFGYVWFLYVFCEKYMKRKKMKKV